MRWDEMRWDEYLHEYLRQKLGKSVTLYGVENNGFKIERRVSEKYTYNF